MGKINYSNSACPNPPSFSLVFRKREDGEAHGLRVGDRVKFRTEVSGAYPIEEGKISMIEILREDITGEGEESYARFYIRKQEHLPDPYGGCTEIRSVSNIHEIIE